jgi:epsilon-lactone hydrolase
MPNLPTKTLLFIERLFQLDEYMARYADAAGDKERFSRFVYRMRKLDQKKPPRLYRRLLQVVDQKVQGFPMYLLSSHEGHNGKVVLYLHGGAYNIGPMMPQWVRMHELVQAAHCRVAVLDYPMAPEYECERTMEVTLAAFERLAVTFGAHNIVIIGDSAGGGLALALTMERKVRGLSLPGRLILLSPWLDISMSNPRIPDFEEVDLSLDTVGLRVQGSFYCGSLPNNHPWVSPMFGDASGLPPIDLYAGKNETFFPDCQDFYEKNQQADICFHPYEGMQHDWVMLPIPEGEQVMQEIIARLKE